MQRQRNRCGGAGERGFALVIVVLIVAILIAAVTEFSSTVYHETVALYGWRDLQNLSLEAESGVRVGETFLRRYLGKVAFTYPDRVDLPLPDIAGDGRDAMVVSLIDENAKLNLNKLVNPNGTVNTDLYLGLKRLLVSLAIEDPAVADRILDWIDRDREERVLDSERNAKNGYFYSVDELQFVSGISEETYKKLLPHVTIFGNGLININSAGIPVLMSLSGEITGDLAERITAYRELKPFMNSADIQKVSGYDGPLGTSLMGRITVKGSAFSVRVVVMREALQRSIHAVIEDRSGQLVYRYWKET